MWAGHRGMVGAAIIRALKRAGQDNLITRTHAELDLTNQAQVRAFFQDERPDQVYLAAAKVGGIHANNTYPAEFIHQNLMIEANIIHAAHGAGVRRLLFLGSSCIYPKFAEQPMREDALLTGTLEPTNDPYAIAKIAGIKLCESYNRQYGRDFRSMMPTNLYGPGDNFHSDNSHVSPARLRRFHEAVQAGAPEVVIWGSGIPMREFLHVDDMAAACVHVMQLEPEILQAHTQPMLSQLNVGTGVWTAPSRNSPRPRPRSPAFRANWFGIQASQTASPSNSSICRACAISAGRPPSVSRTGYGTRPVVYGRPGSVSFMNAEPREDATSDHAHRHRYNL